MGLIIMDNFVDLTGRLLVPNGPGMFMNAVDAANTRDVFELGAFLPVEEAVEHWRTMIDWVRDQQLGTRIFFVNSPSITTRTPLSRSARETSLNACPPSGSMSCRRSRSIRP